MRVYVIGWRDPFNRADYTPLGALILGDGVVRVVQADEPREPARRMCWQRLSRVRCVADVHDIGPYLRVTDVGRLA